jgi:hypothetical protein
VKALQINRQRVNARPKRRRRGDGGRRGFCCDPTCRAVTGEAPVADDERRHRRYLDLVILANQRHVGICREGPATAPAHDRLVIAERVSLVCQIPVVRLMTRLRPAGTGVLALFLLVRRRRLGRRARILVRALERQHQFDQLLFAQLLQITAFHQPMDSEIGARGKGWVITGTLNGFPSQVRRPRALRISAISRSPCRSSNRSTSATSSGFNFRIWAMGGAGRLGIKQTRKGKPLARNPQPATGRNARPARPSSWRCRAFSRCGTCVCDAFVMMSARVDQKVSWGARPAFLAAAL